MEIDKALQVESFKKFKPHLEEEGNERMIFSAPFGTGKTTFLKDFFEAKNQEQLHGKVTYHAIHLFPVNYSVERNEDIFQLIKHDILFQLLGSDIEFEKIQFTNLETLGAYIPNKLNDIAEGMIDFIPKTGHPLIDNIKNIYSVFKDYAEFRSKIKEKNEEKEIIAFLKEFSGKKGGIYEEDFITLLIKDLITRIAETKTPVLVIDDLDRLDPGHIFRILNIFSAHYDYLGGGNKFDLGHIILVCDIQNIRNIFRNKYGNDVDFSGYIDKFYSREIYFFVNHYSMEGWLHGLSDGYRRSTRKILTELDVEFLTILLNIFIKTGKINFRNLLKLDYSTLKMFYERVENEGIRKDFMKFNLTKLGFMLKIIFGSCEELLEKISSIESDSENKTISVIDMSSEEISDFHLRYIMPVITYQLHKFKGADYAYVFDRSAPHTPESILLKFKDNGTFGYCESNYMYKHARKNFWKELEASIRILQEHRSI